MSPHLRAGISSPGEGEHYLSPPGKLQVVLLLFLVYGITKIINIIMGYI